MSKLKLSQLWSEFTASVRPERLAWIAAGAATFALILALAALAGLTSARHPVEPVQPQEDLVASRPEADRPSPPAPRRIPRGLGVSRQKILDALTNSGAVVEDLRVTATTEERPWEVISWRCGRSTISVSGFEEDSFSVSMMTWFIKNASLQETVREAADMAIVLNAVAPDWEDGASWVSDCLQNPNLGSAGEAVAHPGPRTEARFSWNDATYALTIQLRWEAALREALAEEP